MKRKSNSVVTHDVSTAGLHPVITFNVLGAGTFALDMAKISDTVRDRAAVHGMVQRISDAAALSRTDKEGNIIPAAELAQAKYEAMIALRDHYESGTAEWSRVATAGPKGGYLFEALCRVYGHKLAPSDIRAWLDGLSDAEQAALRDDDTIAPVIREIKAARAPVDRPNAKVLLADLTKAA